MIIRTLHRFSLALVAAIALCAAAPQAKAQAKAEEPGFLTFGAGAFDFHRSETRAAQFELQKNLQLTPFFAASGDANPRGFSALLPQAQLLHADRPTITLTPLDDQEFTRRLFTPQTLEGILYLAKTTWPIATVFRLYLENLNWVSNAQSASGPTGVCDQSKARVRSPISPPPARKGRQVRSEIRASILPMSPPGPSSVRHSA